jgi:tetratricopeptide (TPR) repeat protein
MMFVAIGGMGKSAVTWKWFNEIAPHEMRPLAGRVWWSFYESDAHFDNFVARAFSYVSGIPLEEAAGLPRADREDALLTALDRDPYLIVLDGMERLLRAYSRTDAAHVADDDLDARTANWAVRLHRPGANAPGPDAGLSRLRMTADPRAGRFLQRLAAVGASRVLATSRLYPADLETVTGEPVHGVTVYAVDGLRDDDAVNLWREFGVTGGRDELLALFSTFGNYPLLIRALAGAVARFRPAPRDFQRWRQVNAGFDPFNLPLVQRKSHVLEYALGGLTDAESRVLYTTAAFRAPTTYDTLAALLVGADKPCADEAELDRVLSVLEDRGLMGWDKRANRYDLHPVVRGVAWSALDPKAREGIYQRLASHFEALPVVDVDTIKSIDDLAGTIELYHTLVRLDRTADAFDILVDRIGYGFGNPVTYREFAELIELFVEEPGLFDSLRAGNSQDAGGLIAALGLCYIVYGDATRALSTFRRFKEEFPDDYHAYDFIEPVILCALGRLADAELLARKVFNARSSSADSFDIQPLAIAFLRRGCYAAGTAWFSDYKFGTDKEDYWGFFGALDLLEPGLAALRQNDIDGAREFSERISARAAAISHPLVELHAMMLGAAVARAGGEHNRAYELLNDALVLARGITHSDSETGVLIQFAELTATMRLLDEARSHIADAQQLAEHLQLRLRQADAMNVLSKIEHLAGNREAAASAAVEAYRLAWCDGPPFSYEWGIRQARENLAAAGEPEPADLPPYTPIEMPELKRTPTRERPDEQD